MGRMKELFIEQQNEMEADNTDRVTAIIIMEEARNKGGCPQGTTVKRKCTTNLAVVAATNEITSLYVHKMHKEKMKTETGYAK